jgi:hypothetical protein
MRLKAMIIMVSLLLTASLFTESPLVSANSMERSEHAGFEVTTDYLFALHTADQFLNAWLNRDLNTGKTLVTDKVKKEAGENGLFAFFTGTSNPHHQAYEVIGRKRVDDNTFRFQVWLYEHYTGQQMQPTERGKGSTFDVVKVGVNEAGEGIWLVNSLPR